MESLLSNVGPIIVLIIVAYFGIKILTGIVRTVLSIAVVLGIIYFLYHWLGAAA